LSYRDGRFYPSKAPLLSVSAAPIYAVLRLLAGNRVGVVPEIPLVFFARLFLTVLPTLLTLRFLRRFLASYVDSSLADVVVVFYAIGTLAFSYSLQFVSHQTSADLLFMAFYLGWRWARSEAKDTALVLVGFLAAVAVTAEYTSAMAAGLISSWVLFARRGSTAERATALSLLGLGACPPLLVLGAYHAHCFGSPFETGYKHLADAAYQPWHLGGFLGIRTPDLHALLLSLFSPLRGLFALSPGLLIGVLGLRRLWVARTRAAELGPIAMFAVALLVAYLYFTSSFSYESWGWTTGPRHMTGLVPFLLLPLALLLSSAQNSWRMGLYSGLLASSVIVTGLLTMVNYIPDDVSDGFFALTVPLTERGRLVPTVLAFLRLPNPTSGVLLEAAIILLAVFLFASGWRRLRLGGFLSGLTVLLFLSVHAVAYRNTRSDQGALNLLTRIWLAPPGANPSFWSDSGE
jgi:hypothetical protein